MSWFFKPLSPTSPEQQQDNSTAGVKEDLSAIGETIGRQLRGVANFLAPPPPSSSAEAEHGSPPASPSKALVGIKNDLAEIGGSLKSGLSKFTSSFLSFQSNPNKNEEDEGYYGAGLTEEVIGFVEEISVRPECWTDFPLPLRNDFRMSDAQREHASAVEQMVPSLAALRANLHNYIGDEQFWMVYFILLLPRLSVQDLEILSTSQIVETRNLLLRMIKNKRNERVEKSQNASTSVTSEDGSKPYETREVKVPSREKEVTEIVNATKELEINEKEITEHWFEETDVDTSSSVDNRKKLENEEDLSFSDLEDDDNDQSSRVSASKPAQSHRTLSPSGSSDWVQLHESSVTQVGTHKARQSFSRDKDSDIESTDWLKVDESD